MALTCTWTRHIHSLLTDLYEDGYNGKERARRRQLRIIDIRVIVPFCIVVLFIFVAIAPEHAPQHPNHGHPISALVASVLYTLATILVLYEHIWVQQTPTDEAIDLINAMQLFGRWIYLTRIVLTIQAVHATCSFLSDFGLVPALAVPTHASAILVAAVGFFVCVQFFSLVYRDRSFQVACQMWTKRGIPFGFLVCWTHIPCGVFAVLDLILIKDRSLLQAVSPPFITLLVYIGAFTGFYILLLQLNHFFTGHWPYLFMNNFTQWKWMTFSVAQSVILSVFMTLMWALAMYAPVLW